MHLNNNWNRNIDTGKWTPGADNRGKADFDAYKEDLKKIRFYQKCLSGSTYVGVHSPIYGTVTSASMSNIYDVLGYYQPTSYYYNAPLPYSEPFTATIPDDSELISTTASLTTYLDKTISEYNFTLKNLFTPERLINDQKENLFYVDIVTDKFIEDITIKFEDLVIDGIRVKEGHRVLVKDQYTKVTIPTATNPDTFFYGHYKFIKTIGLDTTYHILNSQNGIYKYTKNRLVRTDDLDDYQSITKYSICSKLGTNNREKQFRLKRLNSGFFPEYYAGDLYPSGPDGGPICFELTHNFVLRNRMDYNNLYELVLNDTIKHATQSYQVKITSGTSSGYVTYSIPERTLAVGEFGSILVHQEGISNFIESKYKVTYRSITETSKYYWICGDEGTILRVSKSDFSIKRIQLKFRSYDPKRSSSKMVITKLNSISFFNDLRGIVVGDFNQIWVTSDGGKTWEQIYLTDFDGYNFNTALFTNISKFYIGGDNGVFIEFEYDLGQWYAHKRRISKLVDGLDDEFLLVDDINDIYYLEVNSGSYILIGCAMSNFYLYDINNLGGFTNTNHDFWYIDDFNTLENNFGDISSISYATGSSVAFSTFDAIYYVDVFSGVLASTASNIISATISVGSTQSGVNSLFRYGSQMISAGNFSLWQNTDIGNTASINNVYNDLFTRLKPRMLFMNYDIGSKLYWFDDFSQYRLPERIEVPVNYLVAGTSGTFSSSHIAFNRPIRNVGGLTYSENTWITYWRDRLKTFAYYTNLEDSNVVKPSFTFSSSENFGQVFTYTASTITTNYLDIVNMMPNATPPGQASSPTQSSRFREIVGVPITAPSTTNDLYFYDYLGIWNTKVTDVTDAPSVGDVLEITSDVFSGNFIINRIEGFNCGAVLNATITFAPISSSFAGQEISVLPISLTDGLVAPPPFSVWSQNQYTQALADAINNNTTLGLGHGYSATIDTSNATWVLTITAPSPDAISLVYFRDGGTPTTTLYFASGSHPQCYHCYFYTDFNENIINNIPGSLGNFNVRNLNKYSKLDDVYFIDNFNKHYISYSYNVDTVNNAYNFGLTTSATQSFQFTGKYSQWSAYYNLQTKVDVQSTDFWTYTETIDYRNTFLNFGYSPNYNLLGYLNYLDPIQYTPSKEFFAMPNYIDIPGPDSGQPLPDQLYVDTGVDTNKMYLGSNLKYIWEHIFNWTFVDVTLDAITTKRLLIVDKFYNVSTDQYVIEFDKKMDMPANVFLVSILGRRALKQISDDLQYMNNMHRPEWQVSESYTLTSITGTWSNFESDIKYKVPTDSYTKILLSDSHIVRDITGIVYTDNDSELATQITKLNRGYEFDVVSISINGGYYQFNFSEKHNLYNSDSVNVSMIGTQSDYPDTLLGYHHIEYVNDYSIKLPIISIGLFALPNFRISHVKKDPFFNFQPIDLFDMGIGDKKIKQSIEIPLENYEVDGLQYDLFDIDLTKYKFRMIDGLDLVTLNAEFPWVLDAEISNAVIGIDGGKLNWYRGVWHCGRWFGGNWISGDWLSGDWYEGNWTSKYITDKKLSVEVDESKTDFFNSTWYGGRWFGGEWENGTWNAGRWYGGTWSNGRWFEGTWNDGVWENGEFQSGIWALGQWNNGLFNSDNGPSYWIDGKFYGGDFENGTWYNGTFDQKQDSIRSRFGTRSFNSRNSIWRSGKFLKGEVHSFLNNDDDGKPTVSEVHKHTKWYTGLFASGDWYGGLAYNINFKNAIWHGGISEEINISAISGTANSVVLDGEFDFNVGDQFYVVDNRYGYLIEPDKYAVLNASYNLPVDETTVITSSDIVNNFDLPEGSWRLSEIYTNYDPSIGLVPPYTINTYVPGTANIFEEMIGSEWFIYDDLVHYRQDQLPPPSQFIGAGDLTTSYTTYSIDLSQFIGILNGNETYSIAYGANNTSATFSLTQDPVVNPAGVIIDLIFVESVINKKAVSSFDYSTWNSGVWYNGVFKGGVFNGGVWYNGYFDGTWG